jgi:hypothetical protein
MRLDANLANGDPTLAALVPDGVTLADILGLFQTVYHINGEQLLRKHLGATHPANLALPELAEFIKWLLRALKSASIRDPAAVLAYGVQRKAEAAPNSGLRLRLAISLPKSNLPDQGQSNLKTARQECLPPRRRRWHRPLHSGRRKPRTSGSLARRLPTPRRKRLPILKRRILRRPLPATSSSSMADDLSASVALPKCSAASPRSLQRWRKTGKGPPSTNIGRKVYYDLNDLQEWIGPRKNPVMSTIRYWPMTLPSAALAINAHFPLVCLLGPLL